MRKSVKTIGTITAMGTIAFGSYLLGTTQAGTVTEVQTVTELNHYRLKPVGSVGC